MRIDSKPIGPLYLDSSALVKVYLPEPESARVDRCLATLQPREWRLLLLLFQEGSTPAEAAEMLGTTAGNVRVIRHRALGRLRECVEAGTK